MDREMKKKYLAIAIGSILMFSGIILASNIISVPAGHKGIVIRGTDIGKVYDEGLQIKWILNSVEYVRYNTQERSYVGNDYGDDTIGSIMAITKDNVEVYIDMTIVYHVNPDMVSEVRVQNGEGWREVLIDPIARSIPRDVASTFTVFEIAGPERATLSIRIMENITKELAPKHIIVEEFALRDIRLPDRILESIEKKKASEQDVQTAEYNLLEEEVNAQKLIVIAEAEALAIDVVQEQLTNSTAAYLDWMYIQALSDPNSNIQYVVVPADGSTPILFQVSDDEP